MADMMSMGDLMEGGEDVNKRAKMMRAMQAEALRLRRMGLDTPQIDLLIRGRYGLLRPGEEEAFAEAMRFISQRGRVTAIPGMQKSLRSWPPRGGGGGGPDAASILEGLGIGGGGMMSLEDLLQQ